MTNITLLCGGQSAEHEISIISAKSVTKGFLREPYHVTLIYITQHGEWRWLENIDQALNQAPKDWQALPYQRVLPHLGQTKPSWLVLSDQRDLPVDVVFPVLHGEHAEDGDMQGLLELMQVPYVGCKVLSSAICMDKIISKKVLQAAGIPVAKELVFNSKAKVLPYQEVVAALGSPFFVKPANTGSSIGITKVYDAAQYEAALALGFSYDKQLLLEANIAGREFEVAVLGNDKPKASVIGELHIHHDFYDYDCKYIDPNGMVPEYPAKLSQAKTTEIQQTAIKAYQALQCQGMTRMDFLMDQHEHIYLNEPNTIPGFTAISLYPKLWEASGLSYQDLLDQLVALALP